MKNRTGISGDALHRKKGSRTMSKKKKNSKKTSTKKKRGALATPSGEVGESRCGVLRLVSYNICFEPMRVPGVPKLPEWARIKRDEFFFEIQKDPEKIIPELLELLEEFPDNPQFLNYLATAYMHVNKIEDAEEVVLRNYQANSDYVFARVNYGDFCLLRGDLQKIPGIFDNAYDLKIVYPEREVFHVSEVVGFFALMGRYFLAMQDMDKAKIYLDFLEKIAPRHHRTKTLRRELRLGSNLNSRPFYN